MSSISKAGFFLLTLSLGAWGGGQVGLAAPVIEREPVMLSVVAVNPSADKTQVIPVKIDLPQEITPKDVIRTGELKLEYDEDRQAYYVLKDDVALAPKETRVFEVTVRDVWFVPQPELDSLGRYNHLLLGRLQETEYYPTAKELARSIDERIQAIVTTQNDEALSRRSRIGAYRYHLQEIGLIKEDLARMEKLLAFVGAPAVPEIPEKLKSDAPSKTTTWLVIFLVIIFIGSLGGQFFFTWHRRAKAATDDIALLRKATFSGGPGSGQPSPPKRPA